MHNRSIILHPKKLVSLLVGRRSILISYDYERSCQKYFISVSTSLQLKEIIEKQSNSSYGKNGKCNNKNINSKLISANSREK